MVIINSVEKLEIPAAYLGMVPHPRKMVRGRGARERGRERKTHSISPFIAE